MFEDHRSRCFLEDRRLIGFPGITKVARAGIEELSVSAPHAFAPSELVNGDSNIVVILSISGLLGVDRNQRFELLVRVPGLPSCIQAPQDELFRIAFAGRFGDPMQGIDDVTPSVLVLRLSAGFFQVCAGRIKVFERRLVPRHGDENVRFDVLSAGGFESQLVETEGLPVVAAVARDEPCAFERVDALLRCLGLGESSLVFGSRSF
jgi:hypothetical protein